MWKLNDELNFKVGFLSKSVTYIPSVPRCLVEAGADGKLVVHEVRTEEGNLAQQLQLLAQVGLQL